MFSLSSSKHEHRIHKPESPDLILVILQCSVCVVEHLTFGRIRCWATLPVGIARWKCGTERVLVVLWQVASILIRMEVGLLVLL